MLFSNIFCVISQISPALLYVTVSLYVSPYALFTAANDTLSYNFLEMLLNFTICFLQKEEQRYYSRAETRPVDQAALEFWELQSLHVWRAPV